MPMQPSPPFSQNNQEVITFPDIAGKSLW